ncbi:glycoside hydrolase family 7 protein [Sporormia fimetaria CBS 119925]|uniref:Glucanase n=1 Tax=Sporormia fimetaria CBS 119925 TaxID=1340428 RepID=A0A6A6VDB3_9PLEO|nr:glycoside hydrolase family 7 protein [Sporormia fimetaria CBS 119925]
MAPPSIALVASLLLGAVSAQSLGRTPEVHPKITTWKCTKRNGCKEQKSAIVLDSATHPIYQKDNKELGCGNWGSAPNATVCPDQATCAKNCIMEGISSYADYGVTTKGSSLKLEMMGKNGVASPRVYLLEGNEKKYEMLKLTGNEFSFDVDVSRLPCGMNGALYLSEMKQDGGKSKLNKGGAAYGTGYCDAQCFTTPWVEGVGNIEGKGICCNELDIWEANARATHLAPHTCNKPGLYLCEGEECTSTGVCDKPGCGMNPWRHDVFDYYGPTKEFTIDTSKPFTVVTSFPADSNGKLVEIQRKYIQNGRVFENAAKATADPIDDAYCVGQNAQDFLRLGGMTGMGEAMTRGMVLAMSIWWDEGGFMQWLDSGEAGPCSATEGDPKNVVVVEPRPEVTFSQIRWGEIGSTSNMRKRPHH